MGEPPYGSGGQPPSGDQPRRGDPAAVDRPSGVRKDVVLAVVGALVVAVVAVILVNGRSGDEQPISTANAGSGTSTSTSTTTSTTTTTTTTTTPSPSASPSTAPTSSAPSSAASTSSSVPSSAPGGSSAAPSGPGDQVGFLAQLPGDFLDCAALTPAGDGDVAAATCRTAATQPALVQAVFRRYPDQATLRSVFESQAAERGMSPFPDGTDCSTANGYGQWSRPDRTGGGQLACQVTGEGDVLLVWTDEEFLTEGTVRTPGDSRAEMSGLYDWWTSHRDFRS